MTWATTAKATEKQRNCRAAHVRMQHSRRGVHMSALSCTHWHNSSFIVHRWWQLSHRHCNCCMCEMLHSNELWKTSWKTTHGKERGENEKMAANRTKTSNLQIFANPLAALLEKFTSAIEWNFVRKLTCGMSPDYITLLLKNIHRKQCSTRIQNDDY